MPAEKRSYQTWYCTQNMDTSDNIENMKLQQKAPFGLSYDWDRKLQHVKKITTMDAMVLPTIL